MSGTMPMINGEHSAGIKPGRLHAMQVPIAAPLLLLFTLPNPDADSGLRPSFGLCKRREAFWHSALSTHTLCKQQKGQTKTLRNILPSSLIRNLQILQKNP